MEFQTKLLDSFEFGSCFNCGLILCSPHNINKTDVNKTDTNKINATSDVSMNMLWEASKMPNEIPKEEDNEEKKIKRANKLLILNESFWLGVQPGKLLSVVSSALFSRKSYEIIDFRHKSQTNNSDEINSNEVNLDKKRCGDKADIYDTNLMMNKRVKLETNSSENTNLSENTNTMSEFEYVSSLFENKQDLMEFSSKKYHVLFYQRDRCFYFKHIIPNKFYKCNYTDIWMIYDFIRDHPDYIGIKYKQFIKKCEEEYAKTGIKSDAKFKITCGIDIFKAFIANNFSVVDTCLSLISRGW